MSEDVREGQPSDPAVGDLGLVVHRLELQQVSVAVHGSLLVLLEELLGALGEGTRPVSYTHLRRGWSACCSRARANAMAM